MDRLLLVDVPLTKTIDSTKVLETCLQQADHASMKMAITAGPGAPSINASHSSIAKELCHFLNCLTVSGDQVPTCLHNGVVTSIVQLASLFDGEAYRLHSIVEPKSGRIKIKIQHWDTFSKPQAFQAVLKGLGTFDTRRLKIAFGRDKNCNKHVWLEHFEALRNAATHRGYICSWQRIKAIADCIDAGRGTRHFNIDAFPNQNDDGKDVKRLLIYFLSFIGEKLVDLQFEMNTIAFS